MPESAPTLTLQTAADGGHCAVLGGSWSAAWLAEPTSWRRVSQGLADLVTQGVVTWDLRAITRLDHTGAQLLWNTWGRQWPAQVQLHTGQRTMLARVARFTAPVAKPARRSVAQLYLRLGELLFQLWDHVLGLLTLAGQLLLDGVTLLRAPRRGPWRDVSGHLYRIGATALPVTALVGFTIGVVLAYLMSRQLRQFGADTFIVNILGLAVIRELGPMLAAILIAGRSGSAITAQIGVMRVTEELDAMRVMGIAQGYRLVLPRAIAMAIAMPLISVWTTLAALLGGMLAADVVLGVTPAYFFAALPDAVELSNLWLGLGKSVVFGLLIALIGCHYGLRVKPNTESLGQGTTASVVTAITVVLLVDAVFAVVFKNVGL
ncbi:ABC transporter permease [Rhodoferax sp.]|uniref:MlaE family ABC transporter permease n=1 Tax=Rhodoferax sp. TaxID=50421 RepID=UPI0019E6F52D|nr:ABC transporter permease [Rhodoferax sp.]MBE0474319.1 ABC transporter permease [Rhodoferax sp.]